MRCRSRNDSSTPTSSQRHSTPRRKRSPSRSPWTSASVDIRRPRRRSNLGSIRCDGSAFGRKSSRRSSDARRRKSSRESGTAARSCRTTWRRGSSSSAPNKEAQMSYLRGEGVLTNGLEADIKIARDMVEKGLIEAASAMATRLRNEVDAIGNAYRKATTGIADAEILYARLQREGFHSYEADVALRDTRRSIREGNYARAIEYLERALHAFGRRTNAREALGRAIEEARKRVQFLRGSGLTFLPDIQEVLTRAELEFHQGNFVGSSEDLRIATVLLDQVTRAPNGKIERRA